MFFSFSKKSALLLFSLWLENMFCVFILSSSPILTKHKYYATYVRGPGYKHKTQQTVRAAIKCQILSWEEQTVTMSTGKFIRLF